MKKEITYFNYLKFFLIFLVVFGHFIESFTINPTIKAVYNTIYLFHMPLFVFVSGFFSHNKKGRVSSFLMLFFFVQFLNIFDGLFTLQGGDFKTFANFIFTPYYGLWYLLCLPVWILVSKYIKDVKFYHIIISIIIALIVGYLPFVNRFLSLSRMFYFFPFFLTGKFFGKNKVRFVDTIKKLQKVPIQFCALLVLMASFFIFCYALPNLPIRIFRGSAPYADSLDILVRMLVLMAAAISGFCFLIIVPTNLKNKDGALSFSQIGKRTLSVYILHILLKREIRLESFLPSSHAMLILSTCFVLSLLVVWLTSAKPIYKLFNKSTV